ncbi:MAG: glycosyltransferase [Cytophagales bacterium]|nr:MAG: glycosyltransferase [Cytophagales bacterium]
MSLKTNISIIVPVYEEEESLPELCDWIGRVIAQMESITYEIIMVDDGSSDNSWEVIQALAKNNPSIKGIRFNRNYGKSAALDTGFKACKGEVVITMDADLQDSPDEIPALYELIKSKKYDLVSGWKQKRHDPLNKTIPSKIFNGVVRYMTKIKLNDFNCGLKAYSHDVVKSIEVYGEMHRYIPVIAKWAGFKKIGEKVVAHRARKYGVTKFGWTRIITGFLDLLSIIFVGKFRKSPMHFFGTMGALSWLIGGLMTAWIIIEKQIQLYILKMPFKEIRDIVEQPLFFLALTLLIMGTQLFLAGFLGELISRSSSSRNDYLVKEKLNLD